MISKAQLEQYISITHPIPDECGWMDDGLYCAKYVAPYCVNLFVFLPESIVKRIEAELNKADHDKKGYCHQVSPMFQLGRRFVCTLPPGHNGLCVGGTHENEIGAIFEPEEGITYREWKAEQLAHALMSALADKVVDEIREDAEEE